MFDPLSALRRSDQMAVSGDDNEAIQMFGHDPPKRAGVGLKAFAGLLIAVVFCCPGARILGLAISKKEITDQRWNAPLLLAGRCVSSDIRRIFPRASTGNRARKLARFSRFRSVGPVSHGATEPVRRAARIAFSRELRGSSRRGRAARQVLGS